MCANYLPPRVDQFTSLGLPEPTFDFASEAYPSSNCPIIMDVNDEMVWRQTMFGLVPSWSKDTSISKHTYNARFETVSSKPSYRNAWRNGQFALVPMAAFYEPNYESGNAERWSIERQDHEPFTVAAIYDTWKSNPDQKIIRSFSMLTINADIHPLMRRFHKPEDEKRSLVVIPPEHRRDWLHATEHNIMEFIELFDTNSFTAYNSPRPPKPKKTD